MRKSFSLKIQTYPLPYHQDSSIYFKYLQSLGHAQWLNSNNIPNQSNRFDILVADPSDLFIFSVEDNNKELTVKNPFDTLNELIKLRYQIDNNTDYPFIGGAVGFFSYDLGLEVSADKPLLQGRFNSPIIPSIRFGFYDWCLIQDHKEKSSVIIANENYSISKIDQHSVQLQKLFENKKNNKNLSNQFELTSLFNAEQSQNLYQENIKKIQDYILSGDCYQVNYSQRFSASYNGNLLAAYDCLSKEQRAPFSAYIDLPEGAILSFSPEQFIKAKKISNQLQLTTQPIKGTRPRHANSKQDQILAKELLNSEKDRAENLMIVDLLRNDFGKCCDIGSVQVEHLFQLESFANVHHLVSTVSGRLPKQRSAIDAIRACFPGGSITGAPKKRAMEIISELEPVERSAYCGSIGYFSDCGNSDFNIAIRTLVAHQGTLYCWGGGGITADSKWHEEYLESLSKVQYLMKSLEKRFFIKHHQ